MTYLLFCAVATIFFMVSCDVETSHNGDLDGYWSLRQIDTLGTASTADVSEQRIFWAFQHDLMHADDHTGLNPSCLFRFQHADGTLTVYSPYFYKRLEGDEPIGEVEPLRPFGINAIPETFTIEKLNGSSMVLRSTMLTLHFRKY